MQKLGQHFLTSQKIAEKIATAADLSLKDVVLEIGPGKGILTEELLKKADEVVAVEKDRRLFEELKEKFAGVKNLKLLNADIRDILKIQNSKVKSQKYKLKVKNYKVVANIPYYLTSYLLRLLLEESKIKPKKIVLMIQKEVAQRICAKPLRRRQGYGGQANMNLLALSVQTFGKPKIAFYVKRGSFLPPPKVDSAVIVIDKISEKFFVENKIKPKRFFDFLRLGFSQKRKVLMNNLAKKYPRLGLENAFLKCGLNPKIRAQNLALNNWFCVYKNLEK